MPVFRTAEEKDAPVLRRIWSCSFGDSEESVQGFLNHFGYEIGVVGEESGVVTCAAYIIPTDGIYFPEGQLKSCSYIYAVAVSPEFRGFGLGKELTRAAMRISKERGFVYTVLKPSNSGLFSFYRNIGFGDYFYANEISFSKTIFREPEVTSSITEIPPQEYAQIKEHLLKDFTHIKPTLKGIEFQGKLGQLFSLSIGGVTGCAAIEAHNAKCSIKELLLPKEQITEAVMTIAAKMGAEKLSAVTPAYDDSSSIPNGMIYPPLETSDKKAFLGLAYD